MKKSGATAPSLRTFSRSDVNSEELKRVTEIASHLLSHIEDPEINQLIQKANAVGMPSHGVQACIASFMTTLEFQSEKKKLFSNYKTANLRPDFYLKLSEGRGVILEVERGKTVYNNMDLLDIWKCHICENAQYLFLLVPHTRIDKKGKKMKVYESVLRRIEPFFLEKNYVNVDAAFIFGY